MQMSAGNVLTSVFWDAHDILFIDFLEKGRTIISEYYMALLVRLKEEIVKKRPQLKKKKSACLAGTFSSRAARKFERA